MRQRSGIVRAVAAFRPKLSLSSTAFMVAVLFWVFTAAERVFGYFFLFDDFKLFGQTETLTLIELVAMPHFYYFRPVTHLFASLQFWCFGWDHPQGYLAVSHLIHALNLGLLWSLLIKLEVPATTRDLALTLALLMPFSLEALSWASCQFDLLATFFALLAFRVWRLPSTVRNHVIFYSAVAASMLSKETAVALWCIVALLWSRVQHELRDETALVGSRRGLLVTVFGYLVARAVVMWSFAGADPLAGHRGSLPTVLVDPATLLNMAQHLLALITPGALWSGENPGLSVVYALGIMGGVMAATRSNHRHAGWLLLFILALLLPAAWIERSAWSTAGGRLLYMAGFPFVVLWSKGVAQLMSSSSITAGLTRGLLLVSFVALGMGVWSQTVLWGSAYRCARQTMASFEEKAPMGGNLFIENMPFVMREGPFLLKPYAFEHYRQGQRAVARVRAQPRIYAYEEGQAQPIRGWKMTPMAPPEGYLSLRLETTAEPRKE